MRPTLRVLVVDDERLCRQRITRWLATENDVEVVAECADGGEAVKAIVGLRPDLVFLDVRMPVLDGFEVLRELGDPMPAIVFTTAYEDHAVAAFEVDAVDYLVKPIVRERLIASLDRVRRQDVRGEQPAGPRIVFLRGAKTLILASHEIVSIQSAGNYVKISADDGHHLARASLATLSDRLPDEFVRVHRSWIVNLRRLRSVVRRREGWEALLDNGARVPVGRRYRAALSGVVDDC